MNTSLNSERSFGNSHGQRADSLSTPSALSGGAFQGGGGVTMWLRRDRTGTSLFGPGEGRVGALKGPLSSAEGGR